MFTTEITDCFKSYFDGVAQAIGSASPGELRGKVLSAASLKLLKKMEAREKLILDRRAKRLAATAPSANPRAKAAAAPSVKGVKALSVFRTSLPDGRVVFHAVTPDHTTYRRTERNKLVKLLKSKGFSIKE